MQVNKFKMAIVFLAVLFVSTTVTASNLTNSKSSAQIMYDFFFPILHGKSYELDEFNRTVRHSKSHRHQSDCGFRCDDGTCLKSFLKCDGSVDCSKAEDELDCKCIDRIGSKKICDGFPDCPMMEDEIGCGYGCQPEEFSCSVGRIISSKCIPLTQRCDGSIDCPNEADEKDCYRLTSFDISIRGILSEGVLQKKQGAYWYTICQTNNAAESYWLKKYSKKTCEIIVGEVEHDPDTSVINADSLTIEKELLAVEPLLYVKFGESESKFTYLPTCTSGKIYKVFCPEPKCGWPASKYETFAQLINTVVHQHQHHIHRRSMMISLSQGLTAKIVGGYDSIPGAWPFIVGIYRNGTFHCGGSIINRRWILTAAHCTHGYNKYVFEAQVGMTRRNSWSPYEQSRQITEIHVHEKYDSKIFLHDIALMKVDYPFYLSKWVTTACFPTARSQDPVDGQSCKVIGWGDLSEDGNGPDHLQEVDLPILAECLETFTKDSHQICAGVMEGGKDACQGDSGGPLICYDHYGRHIVNGLVSFGRGCARPNQAGVYTRISSYQTWINSYITEENPLAHRHKRPKECTTGRCFRQGGECVFPNLYCNQDVDCLGLDDEWSCSYSSRAAADEDEPDEDAFEHIRHTSHATEEHTHEYGSAKLCGPSEFQCKTTESCIPLKLKCDGNYDCSDSTDEKLCECGDIIKNSFPEYICDGIHHCLDGSDELECETKICNGDKGMVKCPLSNQCIRESQFCDGTPNCRFSEDEIDCIRITKSKGKTPKEGFLNDKTSRGLHSGYVILRQSSITWRTACFDEFGDSMKEIACPYFGLGTSESALSRIPRTTFNFNSLPKRNTRGTDECKQVKVQCGEPSCGQSRLYSMSQERPEGDYFGALPWLVVVLVEGNPICPATLVHKQWILALSHCIDENIRSTSNQYLSAVAGFSKITSIVASPMEQIKRINAVVKLSDGFTLLHLESGFALDHFATPVCTSSSSGSGKEYCVRVSVTDGTHIKSRPVKIDPGCGKDYHACIKWTDGSCEDAVGSFVYCTADTVSWFLLGYVHSGNVSNCHANKRIELKNPFHSSTGTETEKLLNRPPSSILTNPGCSGTRCTYGNCVGKEFVCDGIGQCPDYLDERRCQRHYQVLRAHDDNSEYENRPANSTNACSIGHFQCQTTGNCIPISAFCDSEYDCGDDDWSDEPANEADCSCRHYLELAAPERICDPYGKDHCPDRGDEIGCPCTSQSFVCDSNSRECIHKNLVCDNVRDCRNGRDETNCIAVSEDLQKISFNRPRTEKLEGYVLVRVKGSWHPYCFNEWSQDLGEKICNFMGYRYLNHIHNVEIDEANFPDESIVDGESDDRKLLWLLNEPDGHTSIDAGPLEEVVSKLREDEDYECTLGHISCF